MNLDDLDRQLIRSLMKQGRVKWSTLAAEMGISPPAIADRVRRLESAGLITGYRAQVNRNALGYTLTAFVVVTLAHPKHRESFLAYVQSKECIWACHHIVGEGDYLLEVWCQGTTALEKILSDEIKGLEGVIQTRTTISLSAVKTQSLLPLEES